MYTLKEAKEMFGLSEKGHKVFIGRGVKFENHSGQYYYDKEDIDQLRKLQDDLQNPDIWLKRTVAAPILGISKTRLASICRACPEDDKCKPIGENGYYYRRSYLEAAIRSNGRKKCSGCEQEKHHKEFKQYSQTKDGLDYYCKECRKRSNSRASRAGSSVPASILTPVAFVPDPARNRPPKIEYCDCGNGKRALHYRPKAGGGYKHVCHTCAVGYMPPPKREL